MFKNGDSEAKARWSEMITGARVDPPLDILRHMYQAGVTESMLEHLCLHRHRKCGIDKDRIFALRGLCTESERTSISVDYDLTVDKIFLKYTRRSISRTGSLNILGTCLPLERMHPLLPSWVTDWSNSEARCPIETFATVHTSLTKKISSKPYAVLPGTTAHIHEMEGDMEHVLATNGYRAQTLSHASSNRPDTVPYIISGSMLGSIMNDFWKVAQNLTAAQGIDWLTTDTTVSGPNEHLVNAFWRTMIADRDRLGQRDSDPGPGQGSAYWSVVSQSIHGRKFFVTEEGDMGLGPYDVQQGDHICVLRGAEVPFVLRSDSEHQTQTSIDALAYTLVGECYCHTLMENVDVKKLGNLQRFEIW
jgi:hypothetical protein